VLSAAVHADANNAPGLLLAAWLRSRLGVEVTFDVNAGPGITQVSLTTDEGEVSVTRTDGKMATFSAPDSPTLAVALRRREVAALITEELRVLESDHVFTATMAELAADESLAQFTSRS
jgi:glucose-6-phosphate dehydrogenase assembly protein OpcA